MSLSFDEPFGIPAVAFHDASRHLWRGDSDMAQSGHSSSRQQCRAINLPRQLAELGRSQSASFDHRRRPETLRTAMATAFFCPTNTTSRFPLVTPV